MNKYKINLFFDEKGECLEELVNELLIIYKEKNT